jgi:hypothetical protein
MHAYASFGSQWDDYKEDFEAYVLGAQWARQGNRKLPKTFETSRGTAYAMSSQLAAIDFRKGWIDFGKGRNLEAAPTCPL